jgi:hypothetical protein
MPLTINPNDPNYGATDTSDPAADFAKIAAAYGVIPLNRATSPLTANDWWKVVDTANAPDTGVAPVPRAQPGPADVVKPVTNLQPAQNDLGSVRQQRFLDEFQKNPALLPRLMASIQAEVGGQGDSAKQAYVESVMNRAIARNKSLYDTISDPKYYPTVTINRLNRPVSVAEQDHLFGFIHNGLQGSNVSNFATGNASGSVGFGGGPQTYAAGGEKFGVEKNDSGWHAKLGLAGGAAAGGGDTGISDPDLAATVGPVYIQPVDPAKIDEIGKKLTVSQGQGAGLGAEDIAAYAKAQADQYAAVMDKSGTPLTVGEYKQQMSAFYGAAQKMNIGIMPQALPVDQADKLAALNDGVSIVENIRQKQQALWDKTHPPIPGLAINLPIEQTDEYKAFDAARQLGLAQLARGVGGQSGTLTDSDLKIIKDALPNEHDTPAQAAAKTAILQQQSIEMMKNKLQYLRASHFDTSGFETLYGETAKAFADARTNKDLDVAQGAVERQAHIDKQAAKSRALTLPTPQQPPQQPPQPPRFDSTVNNALPPGNVSPEDLNRMLNQ